MSKSSSRTPLIRRPWFAFLSSMRFAVALLCLLGLASVVGTVLKQNESMTGYLVEFGPFWHPVFQFLGLYDVYSSSWFVVIMLFLVLSTSLCLWRNIPPFVREMRSFRLKATRQSLAHMPHSTLLPPLAPEVVQRYLEVSGFAVKSVHRDNGEVLLAAKKGSANKLGYICAHAAIVVICLGGLIDSNMWLKLGVVSGRLVPDATTLVAKEFKPESRLDSGTLSFRGDVNVSEGQSADVVFLNAGNGFLVQDLPFMVTLRQFHVEYYDTGMPKNFASDITVTDKATGEKTDTTIRVNHPLTVHGITIYQASFGDGGSKLRFNSWDLASPQAAPTSMEAVSMNDFPFKLRQEDYTLEFGELRPINVENEDEAAVADKSWQQKMHDVRSVNQDQAAMRNVGPTVTYKIRDAAGQAHEFMNYMLPLKREEAWFFASGARSNVGDPFRWLMLPADRDGKIDTFMALRQVWLDADLREKVAEAAVKDVEAGRRASFKEAVQQVLRLFSEGGYVALNDFVAERIPAPEQEKMREFFYQLLYAAADLSLSEALVQSGQSAWGHEDPARNRFVLNSLDGYTGLTRYPAPMLMQLSGYSEVKSSGLQMTRSPGQGLVYLGSLLLVLGSVFMFYVREKRAWILFGAEGMRFAMSANRHARDLAQEFPQHAAKLEQLHKDLHHDEQ
ncbi:cytochrome c biogenesis protein [Neisseria sp. HSC-16F19]|nr:cytochrome c biogenesis protein ResB [Neisseria sp. HSC-16F19]MCP2041026.1 cytochrome c biogenesis protein [Neisseria sp. HSC-16F19]